MIIINGKKIAREILKAQKHIIQTKMAAPGLATILIGDNEASKIYINEKQKKAARIGVNFFNYNFPSNISQKEVETLINSLNADSAVHGIIVQFPISKHLNADDLILKIAPHKDADGFHPENIRKFLALSNLKNLMNADFPIPVTPCAIIEILNHTLAENPRLAPKNPCIVVIGKCSIFIEPLIHYFKLQSKGNHYLLSPLTKGGPRGVKAVNTNSFTVISPDDPSLTQKTLKADIIIAAAGRPHILRNNMVKQGAIVIEMGVSRVEGKIIGDVDFNAVACKTAAITPTIGGLGPVTVAILLRNVVRNCFKD